MSKIAKRLSGILIAMFSITATSVALAQPPDQARPISLRVYYPDLDLARAADVRHLYRRIELAAQRACGESEEVGSRLPSRAWERCVAAAVQGAVHKVNRPALTAYHREHANGTAREG